MIGPLPTPVAIVLAILTFMVAGLGAFILSVRKDVRESRLQPAVDEQQRLEDIRLGEEIAEALREGQRKALAEYRALMEAARSEATHAREDAARSRADAQAAWEQAERAQAEAVATRAEAASLQKAFRVRLARIEELLRQNKISIPDWWHDPI